MRPLVTARGVPGQLAVRRLEPVAQGRLGCGSSGDHDRGVRAVRLHEVQRGGEHLDSIESLTIDPVDRSRFRVEVLTTALGIVEEQGADTRVVIAGRPAAEPGLRDGLEAAYRDLAGYASSRDERTHLVDQANAVRRWTLT